MKEGPKKDQVAAKVNQVNLIKEFKNTVGQKRTPRRNQPWWNTAYQNSLAAQRGKTAMDTTRKPTAPEPLAVKPLNLNKQVIKSINNSKIQRSKTPALAFP